MTQTKVTKKPAEKTPAPSKPAKTTKPKAKKPAPRKPEAPKEKPATKKARKAPTEGVVAVRVARGARMLDARNPDWFKRVKIGELRAQDPDKCVLGQLYGSFINGCRDLEIVTPDYDEAARNGFDALDYELDAIEECEAAEYRLLDAAWRDAIRYRRTKQKK